MGVTSFFVVLALLAPATAVRVQREAELASANPIRKVVNMLVGMQKKVQSEGAKEEELYDKFMCYCTTGGSELQASIDAAETKIPQVSSSITEAEEKLAGTKGALKKAQDDRAAAKVAMAEASKLREKDAAAYAKEKSELDANIAAVAKAVAALEKGMAGAFLQTNTALVLKGLALASESMGDSDRQELLAFLTGAHSSGYAPASGEITGILKQMGDTMSKSLSDSTAEENSSKATFEELMAAKSKEVAALTASIETKIQQVGELGVNIVAMKNDLSDTQEALEEDKKFLANMEKMCAAKKAEWEVRSKTRAAELLALSETIKVLNDDDALELFKKTLPGASSSFVQLFSSNTRERALAVVSAVRGFARSSKAQLDLIMLSLSGKGAVDFGKVIKMIDDMVALLKKEQVDDDSQKEFCEASLDKADDKRKALDRSKSDEENAISQAEEGIETLADELKALAAGISALDKSVAEATDQRKAENAEYKDLMASDAAAKDLLLFAKNRLNKFYNPTLYKPAAKVELAGRDDRIVANMAASFVQLSKKDAPAPPPETFGAYAGAKEENTGVIAMIDLLIADMDKEMQEAETEEKAAQEEYQTMMEDSAEKRTTDSKSVSDKGSAKANLESELVAHKSEREGAMRELLATLEYIQSLHGECDWLLQNFDNRKGARSGEVDSLVKAKAILSGMGSA